MLSEDRMIRMTGICNYFELHSSENPSFYAEFLAAKAINNILFRDSQFSTDDFLQILNMLEELEQTGHHNGSGWLDYRLHLSSVISYAGIEKEAAARMRKLIDTI